MIKDDRTWLRTEIKTNEELEFMQHGGTWINFPGWIWLSSSISLVLPSKLFFVVFSIIDSCFDKSQGYVKTQIGP